jgi:hypothetical protein
MLQKECFAASTHVVTHQQAQFFKTANQKSKHKPTPANPPPTGAGEHATGQRWKTSFPAGKNQHRQLLFSFPKPSITGRKKNQKKTPRQIKSTKPEKTKPKLQILSSKIKSKQQI